MTRPRVCLGALLALAVVAPAFAQTGAPKSDTSPASPAESGRFTFSPVADGVLRLDTRTGRVSLCSDRNGWVCESVADDRTAYEKEIERLQEKVASLEAQLGKRSSSDVAEKLPSDAEVDQIMNFFERVMRRFMTMMQSLVRENEQQQGT